MKIYLNSGFKSRFFVLLLLILSTISVGKLLYWAKDGFDIRRIGTCPKSGEEINVLEEWVEMVNQPFTYLGRGRQSFAFLSQDGKYVLKLPRMDRYNTKLWIRSIPFFKKLKARSDVHKKMRSEFVFNSFRIAERELKEETGLLFVHLEKTKGLPTIQIKDRIGQTYLLHLDETIFLLQKNLPIGFPKLMSAIEEGDLETAKQLIDRFLDLCFLRAKKQIFNRDSNFLMNFAYDGDQFIQIDVGSFHYVLHPSEKGAKMASFREAVFQLRRFVQITNPELSFWIDKRIDEKLCEL